MHRPRSEYAGANIIKNNVNLCNDNATLYGGLLKIRHNQTKPKTFIDKEIIKKQCKVYKGIFEQTKNLTESRVPFRMAKSLSRNAA